ncbi:MAG: HNH endonuclease [Brevibacterium sp.]|uniref:HNH endonuclease signature motif containing protein n=1 Tax=Brevibacterium sandarakinum TaxID=629680 RepID=UPI0026506DA2|nr:HNH endonuclease signature motif containing protein [Brevibacterium sandarakinum]MDN5585055.1 HNH endonuclease [Brevibacterium sp.]MDN5634020.1 HNH endonuclease [Brevibacterium sp.]MDN5656662.1 HNH endonuclease [Brevibacterium sandarakinum]
MTLTPDRTPQNPEERDSRARSSDAATGSDAADNPSSAGPSSSAIGRPSLFDQLKDANLDLTGHPLAKKFESLAAVSTDEPRESNAHGKASEDVEPAASTSEASVSEASVSEAPDGDADKTVPAVDALAVDAPADSSAPGPSSPSPHPLLSSEEWTDLSRFAPEVTTSLTALSGLKDGLRTFDRPMGPADAIKLIDGLEALGRVNEALSTLALAVCERVGTPTDYGAKTTKALIQDRLNITSREANRRSDMAKSLGGRVTLTGQPQAPLFPMVADAFNDGRLSADQARVIKDCLKRLPTWVSQDDRDYAESTLVDKAPSVRVHDLRAIFARILAHIDPDGQEPADSTDRTMYKVNMHARDNGDWEICGLLDPVTGGVLNGLLTARTKIANSNDTTADVDDSGVLEDGTLVDMTGQKLSAQEWIYERFATLIGRIDMTRTGQGSQYALVVTAKAEDLANGTGAGTTGTENPVPISELIRHGLNGAVFFELISEKAKTMQVVTENRFANAKQIAVLTARDQGCTFPGCDAPPGWCDAHHIVEWAQQGKTDINNMTLSCSAHHHLLDRSEWETVMLKDGRPAWVPPASIDPARRPILHARFVAQEVIDTLFNE